MKNYTVKQIAEMLKTNEETVRRWIRSGKLGASLASKKEGHVITADSLNKFINATPKYASAIAGTFAASPLALSVAIGSVLGGLVTLIGTAKQVTEKDVENCIKKRISEHEHNVIKKEAQVAKLIEEIAAERKEIEKYQYALENLDMSVIADSVNAEKK